MSERRTPHSSRARVTRQRAIAAAVELADESGVEALTMRRLAERLGIEAMSLYHHVRNKDDLLDGMVDAVFGEIELPGDGTDWRTGMARRATSAREVLARHPWAIALIDSRRSPGAATLRHHDAVIGCLRRDGFPVRLAAHAFAALDAYIYGFALQEAQLPFSDGDDMSEVATALLPATAWEELPHLAELAAEVVMQPGYRFADEFEFGLTLLLDGLERAARPGSPARTRRPARS